MLTRQCIIAVVTGEAGACRVIDQNGEYQNVVARTQAAVNYSFVIVHGPIPMRYLSGIGMMAIYLSSYCLYEISFVSMVFKIFQSVLFGLVKVD